jgi:branched-chain amino acid aminotransferase
VTDLADRDGVIWMDGRLVPWRDAAVHVLSHGLHYGTSVFEGARIYDGRVFKLTEHSARLRRSAELMGFPLPWSTAEIDRATELVVGANGGGEAYARPVAWRGSERIGLSGQGTSIHLAIAAWPWPAVFGSDAEVGGIGVGLTRWRRPAPDMLPVKAKTAGIYAAGALARGEAERAGFEDALLLDHRGDVAEASGANLFLVERGRLVTPAADGFLDGITRAVVMEEARSLGLEVAEERVSRDRLMAADEVFLTGTAYEVQPVSRVDGRTLPVGEITCRLVRAYRGLVRVRSPS